MKLLCHQTSRTPPEAPFLINTNAIHVHKVHFLSHYAVSQTIDIRRVYPENLTSSSDCAQLNPTKSVGRFVVSHQKTLLLICRSDNSPVSISFSISLHQKNIPIHSFPLTGVSSYSPNLLLLFFFLNSLFYHHNLSFFFFFTREESDTFLVYRLVRLPNWKWSFTTQLRQHWAHSPRPTIKIYSSTQSFHHITLYVVYVPPSWSASGENYAWNIQCFIPYVLTHVRWAHTIKVGWERMIVLGLIDMIFIHTSTS